MIKLAGHFIFFACAGIALAGCTHPPSDSETSTSQTINLTHPQFEYYDADYIDNFALMVRNNSRGSVEVFSLDNPAVKPLKPLKPSAPLRSVERERQEEARALSLFPAGQSHSSSHLSLIPPKGRLTNDSSVKIYPLGETYSRRDLVPLAPVSALLSPVSKDDEVEALSSSLDVSPLSLSLIKVEPSLDDKLPQERSVPVATVYFDHDSAYLGVEAEKDLAELVALYNHSGGGPVFVEGHASKRVGFVNDIRRKTVNLKVSMDRAFSVARALIEAGLPAEVVETKAYGESRPADVLYDDLDEETAARRVEIQGLR